jgi:tyrosyl-tRNA synthetase
LPLIFGTDGKPMSKTAGNCIWLTDSPDQMYGKVMSIPDNLIDSYFRTLTTISREENKGLSPRDAKAKLAQEIASAYHGKKEALRAAKEFEQVFKRRELPSRVPAVQIKEKKLNILDLLVKIKLAPSKSGAKRLVEQKGVKINGQTQDGWRKTVEVEKGMVVQVGKRKFIKVV